MHFISVHFPHVRRLAGNIKGLGRFRLHAEGELEGFDARPAELEFSRWLFRLALDTVERRAREINQERENLMRLEDDGWVATSAGEAAVKDEIYDFYQPDEEMRLEDLIADGRVPTPEETLARREFQQYINRTLAALPRRWREAFVLYSVEGLTLEEVARVTRQPVDDARRSIEMAREYLRECLVEAGALKACQEAAREEVKAL